jgi:hypothetical protein
MVSMGREVNVNAGSSVSVEGMGADVSAEETLVDVLFETVEGEAVGSCPEDTSVQEAVVRRMDKISTYPFFIS